MKTLISFIIIISLSNNSSFSQDFGFSQNIKEAKKTKANKIKTLKIYYNYNSRKQLGSYHEYDQNGNETYSVSYYNDTSVSSEEKSYYDEQYRIIKAVYIDHYNNYNNLTTYEYNVTDIYPYKRIIVQDGTIKETYFYYNNNLLTKSVNGSFEHVYEYDNMNRIISSTYPGNKTTYHYDKNKVTIKNTLPQAKYRTIENIYNESGLLIEYRRYDNNMQMNAYGVYTYDNNGNIIYTDEGSNENSTSRSEYVYEFYE